MSTSLAARLWRGELPLHDTFWRYVIIYALLVNIATTLGFMVLLSNDQPAIALFVGYGLSVPYNVLALLALWRSADKHDGDRSTAQLMRIAGAAWIVLLTVT